MINVYDIFKSLSNSFLASVFHSVHAEEDIETGDSDSSVEQGTAADVATFREKIRTEVSARYNDKIKSLKSDKKNLSEQYGEAMTEIGNLTTKVKELQQIVDSDTRVKDLSANLEKIKAEYADFKAKTPKEEDIRAEVEKHFQVELYKRDKIAENKADILDVFMNGISGETEAEIDAAIDNAKQLTLDTKKQLGIVDADGKPVAKGIVPPTAPPAANAPKVPNPSLGSMGADLGINTNDIAKMDVRSDEYAKLRELFGFTKKT